MFVAGRWVVRCLHFLKVAQLCVASAILSKIPIWQKNCTLYLLYVF